MRSALAEQRDTPIEPLPRLERIIRRSAVLKPSTLPCIGRQPTINVTQGCAHRCVYCYARAYGNYPGDHRVQIYANLADKLSDELARRRTMPAQVHFSPSTDCFGPYAELQRETYRAMAVLLDRGIDVSFLTKGQIRRPFYDLFSRHPGMVYVQIGLLTVDDVVARRIEPLAATPGQRLRNIRALRRIGVGVGVRIDPMIPELTDTPDRLARLFRVLGRCGVRHVAASYLFLRPGIRRRLQAELRPASLRDRILSAYRHGARIVHRASPQGLGVVALPARRRIEGYDRLRTIARRFGITVSICGCKNGDLNLPDRCHLNGLARPKPAPQQLTLFGDPDT